MQILSRHTLRWVAVLVLLLGVGSRASAQLVLPFVPELDDVPVDAFSYAGFVDGAVPMSQVRLRVDGAYDGNRPTRNEYFMAPQLPSARGLPLPERRVDYQELHAYAEYAFSPIVSAFIDAPYRFLDPTLNTNHNGPSDVQVGVKYAFFQQGPLTSSIQLRGYFPSGDAAQGLGTGHSSLEPGLLFLWEQSSMWRVEGEVHAWVPIDDENYGGEIVRYGLAFSYGERNPDGLWFAPVVEGQGWSCVRGKETVAFSAKKSSVVKTNGDTIVNGDVGVRGGWGTTADLFVGYSRALTGDVWYKDMVRVELRWFY